MLDITLYGAQMLASLVQRVICVLIQRNSHRCVYLGQGNIWKLRSPAMHVPTLLVRIVSLVRKLVRARILKEAMFSLILPYLRKKHHGAQIQP